MNMNTFCMEDFHAPVKSILYMYFINRVPMVKEDAVTTSVKVKQIYIKKILVQGISSILLVQFGSHFTQIVPLIKGYVAILNNVCRSGVKVIHVSYPTKIPF